MSFYLVFCCFSFLFGHVLGQEELIDDCNPAYCRKHGPTIKFPFRNKNLQPEKCGYPGFVVFCDSRNETVLELPSVVHVAVKSISYADQIVHLYDEYSLAEKLLVPHLNLSASPFHFFSNSKTNYTLFNCSNSGSIQYIPSDIQMNSYYDLTSCMNIGNATSVPDEIFDQNNVRLKWSEPAGHRSKTQEIIKTGYSTIKCSVIILLASIVILCFLIWTNRKNHLKIEMCLEDHRAMKPTRFSYSDLKRITLNFSEKLGEGGYGIVYKGKLTNEINVAVKVLNNFKGDGEEFVNEVSTIGRIHHVNVVRLVGFCAQGSKRALVYEFLPNDSLEKFIFQSSSSKKKSLGWKKLRDIAKGIAKGIEYLHEGCDQQILHFDIKPHNILLDQNFNPKICDFGLAKFCSKEQSGVTMTDARGTMGYIAPEVMSRTFGRVSYKSDVYSFGMLLLEMVGGRKNTDANVNTSQVYFPQWAYERLHLDVGEDFWAEIAEGEDGNIARRLTMVGLWCIQWCPTDRPSMKEVVQMLEGDAEESLAIPPNPFPATNCISRMIPPESHHQIELALIAE